MLFRLLGLDLLKRPYRLKPGWSLLDENVHGLPGCNTSKRVDVIGMIRNHTIQNQHLEKSILASVSPGLQVLCRLPQSFDRSESR
jgi:hypothetical protein